jgi:hypothetical protein
MNCCPGPTPCGTATDIFCPLMLTSIIDPAMQPCGHTTVTGCGCGIAVATAATGWAATTIAGWAGAPVWMMMFGAADCVGAGV